MKTQSNIAGEPFEKLPKDYVSLCRDRWLPRPIHDEVDLEAAMSALKPCWGREEEMNSDQSDWFQLVTSVVAGFQEQQAKAPQALPIQDRLAGLIEAHGMSAADLGHLLGLESSMGSKILKGARSLTVSHIQKLSEHFGMPADYFLDAN